MHIKELYIYGFGKWIDQKITFVDEKENITLIYGENEAGKSTLYHFIIYMFFNLPPRIRKQYMPKMSSRFGGEIVLHDKNGDDIVIQRTDNRFILKTKFGNYEDESMLKSYLYNLSQETFEAIFAVKSEQLETIREVDSSHLNEVLMSISISGIEQLYNVENELKKTMDTLFKQQGRKPVLNIALKEIAALESNLHEAKESEQRYVYLQRKLGEIEKQNERLQEEGKNIESEIHFLNRLSHLVIELDNYKTAIEFNDKHKYISFPYMGSELYEKYKKEKNDIRVQLEYYESLLKGELEKEEKLNHSLLKQEVINEIEWLLNKQKDYELLKQKINEIQLELKNINETYVVLEKRTGLSETEVRQILFNDLTKDDWQRLKIEYEEHRKNDIELQRDEEKYYLAYERLNEEKNKIKLMDHEAFNHLKMAIDKSETNRLNNQLKDIALKERKRNKKLVQFSSVVATVAFILYFVLNYSSLLYVGIAAIIFTIVSYFMNKMAMNQMNSLLVPENKKLNKEDIHRYEEEVEKRENLKQLKWKMQQLKDEELRIEIEKEKVHANELFLERKINEAYRQFPFLHHIKVEKWPEYFEEINKMQLLLEKHRQLSSTLADYQDEVRIIESQIEKLRQNLKHQTLHIYQLDSLLEKNEDDLKELKDVKKNIEEKEEKVSLLYKQKISYAKEIENLFAQANVDNEEDFYKRNMLYKQLQESKKFIEQFEQKLRHTFTKEERIRLKGNEWTDKEVSHSIENLIKRKDTIDLKLKGAYKELAEINQEIQSITHSDELSRLTYQYEIKQEEIKDMAKKWLTYKLSFEAIQRAKQQFQEKHLKEVLKKTSEFFRILTKNNYEQVNIEDSTMTVLHKNGYDFTVKELSKGTVDQLYLSLRLAVGLTVAQSIKMPYIFDDVFVHFDSKRREELVTLIKKLSIDRQMIIFSCDERIDQMFSENHIEKRVVKHRIS